MHKHAVRSTSKTKLFQTLNHKTRNLTLDTLYRYTVQGWVKGCYALKN